MKVVEIVCQIQVEIVIMIVLVEFVVAGFVLEIDMLLGVGVVFEFLIDAELELGYKLFVVAGRKMFGHFLAECEG